MFEAVLVRQLSRLSRRNSLKAAAQIICPLCDAGIKIIDTVHGDLKLDTPGGRIILSVMAEMDHAENVSRALNITNGMLRAAEKGSWSGCAPYGYRCIGEVLNKQLVLDVSLKVGTVLRTFELSAAGESGEGIARILNADGIPSPKGGQWLGTVVLDILRRPVYYGEHRWNYQTVGKYYSTQNGRPVKRSGHWMDADQERARKETRDPSDWVVIPGHWPAIVSRELWDQVQQQIANNSRHRPKNQGRSYRFSSLLHCGYCGQGMVGNRGHYRCRKCGSTVVEKQLAEAIAKQMLDTLTPKNIKALRANLPKRLEKPQLRRSPSLKSLQQEIEKQNKKLVLLDADEIRPVREEIRRLREQLNQAQCRQQRTVFPLSRVNAALDL